MAQTKSTEQDNPNAEPIHVNPADIEAKSSNPVDPHKAAAKAAMDAISRMQMTSRSCRELAASMVTLFPVEAQRLNAMSLEAAAIEGAILNGIVAKMAS